MLNIGNNQRIKSSSVKPNLISLVQDFLLYTTLSLDNRIHRFSIKKLIEKQITNTFHLERHKRISRGFFSNFNLFPTKTSQIFKFSALSITNSKMKDLINKNSNDLIIEQEIAYNSDDR